MQLSLISSFTRHMRVLGPYMSPAQERVLYSEWALMESKADYDRIYLQLETIAKKNAIRLPENKIYSLFTI